MVRSTIDMGFPVSPPWTRNWFERMQVRVHITPKHMREWFKKKERITSLVNDVWSRLHTLQLLYSVVVDWGQQRVMFARLEKSNRPSLIVIPFDMLLGEHFDPKSFTEIGLFYKKD